MEHGQIYMMGLDQQQRLPQSGHIVEDEQAQISDRNPSFLGPPSVYPITAPAVYVAPNQRWHYSAYGYGYLGSAMTNSNVYEQRPAIPQTHSPAQISEPLTPAQLFSQSLTPSHGANVAAAVNDYTLNYAHQPPHAFDSYTLPDPSITLSEPGHLVDNGAQQQCRHNGFSTQDPTIQQAFRSGNGEVALPDMHVAMRTPLPTWQAGPMATMMQTAVPPQPALEFTQANGPMFLGEASYSQPYRSPQNPHSPHGHNNSASSLVQEASVSPRDTLTYWQDGESTLSDYSQPPMSTSPSPFGSPAPNEPNSRASEFFRSRNSVPGDALFIHNDYSVPRGRPPKKLANKSYAGPDYDEEDREKERVAKDEFLVAKKGEGWTYRRIKREGGFKEAESTLRGRYRELTKPRSLRVRKPEWTDGDIRLLNEAVGAMLDARAADGHNVPNRVPKKAKELKEYLSGIRWVDIADYIGENGGSYPFCGATCRRKWTEVNAGKTRLG